MRPDLARCYISVFLVAQLFMAYATSAQFILNSDASWVNDNCVRIVPNEINQAGSVWYKDKIDLTQSFDLQLRLYFGCRDQGADGIVFVLQPISTSVGGIGGGLGFVDISPSLGIEFDTYQNNNYGDPPYDHIAISRDGNVIHAKADKTLVKPVPAAASFANIEDCQEHLVRISWDADAMLLKVFFDCDLRSSYKGDLVKDIFNGDPSVYWGFTSGTGAERNEHRVCLLYNPFVSNQKDTVICRGSSVALRPAGGQSYRWFADNTLSDTTIANPIAFPEDSYHVYRMRIMDACGSSWTDSIEVFSIDFKPDIGDTFKICPGEVAFLQADIKGASYLWQDGSTTPGYNATDAGTYWVEATVGGCSRRDTAWVVHSQEILPRLGPGRILCKGDTLMLDAGPDYKDHIWSTGIRGRYLQVSRQGDYYVEVTDSCGRKLSSSIHITLAGNKDINLGRDTSICPGTPLLLHAESAGATAYRWQDSSTGPAYIATGPGTYWVAVTIDGCENFDTLVIRDEGLQIDLGPDRYICHNESFTFRAGPMYDSYTWQDGSTDSIFSASASGAYHVRVGKGDCEAMDSVNLFVYERPKLRVPKVDSICLLDDYLLDAGPGFMAYRWEDNTTGQSRMVNGPGKYRIYLTDSLGCTAADTFTLFRRSILPVFIPTAFTPNGDDLNEKWEISGLEDAKNMYLQVYNRWGERIYESWQKEDMWDGTFKGKISQEGLYLYLLRLQDCDRQNRYYRGSFQLLR